jgi:hypothetical protein
MKSPFVACSAAALCTLLSLALPAVASASDPQFHDTTTWQRLMIVPEPALLLLLGVGLTALAVSVRTRRRRS